MTPLLLPVIIKRYYNLAADLIGTDTIQHVRVIVKLCV